MMDGQEISKSMTNIRKSSKSMIDSRKSSKTKRPTSNAYNFLLKAPFSMKFRPTDLCINIYKPSKFNYLTPHDLLII